jgi:hypothetical protein
VLAERNRSMLNKLAHLSHRFIAVCADGTNSDLACAPRGKRSCTRILLHRSFIPFAFAQLLDKAGTTTMPLSILPLVDALRKVIA